MSTLLRTARGPDRASPGAAGRHATRTRDPARPPARVPGRTDLEALTRRYVTPHRLSIAIDRLIDDARRGLERAQEPPGA